MKFLDEETEDRLFINTFIQMGAEQNNLEIAKRMLEKNIDISLISEVTGISQEDIDKLK